MSESVGNPFGSELAAGRYAAGRLDVHAEFARRIGWGLGGRVRRALDIGCGTGLSTRALAAIADDAVGIDVSRPMLREAARRGRARLVLGRGEGLPFSAASFDLLTMGSAFHGCEPKALLAEARRVLASDGYLAVFDHCVLGHMEDEPRFADWFADYRKRFTAPPRHPGFDPALADGFVPVARERFEHPLPLRCNELLGYVTSQSNVLAAVGEGRVRMEDAEAEVRAGLEPLFRGRPFARIRFRGEIDLLRRVPRSPP